MAAVVVRWKIFSSHRRGWCVVCLLFFDSYEERKERVRWLRWYLGNASHAGPKFIWRGTPDRWVEKIFHPIGGETSGFTTATTAKAMNALSGKGLACGGHPPQGTTVITAPPQQKRTPESVLDDWGSNWLRFRPGECFRPACKPWCRQGLVASRHREDCRAAWRGGWPHRFGRG